MKVRKIIGWLMIVAGGAYVGILGASWISGASVSINIPLLVVSLIMFFIGISLIGQGKKFNKQVEKFKRGKGEPSDTRNDKESS